MLRPSFLRQAGAYGHAQPGGEGCDAIRIRSTKRGAFDGRGGDGGIARLTSYGNALRLAQVVKGTV
ncbi:MAG TPA: hypothetical protein DCL54_12480 [Alphaproteobacteria bacterium]|nr:hypothetical protein [Alphaproteobacteria bacterium]HAJ47385.1 hypothetical protein [Alphaproteobacteria bacterium]